MNSRLPKEIQRKIFELTLALYRVTDFFPPAEPLRKHLREKGGEIFGLVSEYDHSPEYEREAVTILSKLESMRGYLNIARSLRFVRPINITVLEREYDFLLSFFTQELENIKGEPEESLKEGLPTWAEFATEKPVPEVKATSSKPFKKEPQAKAGEVNERQKKILEYINKVSQAKISDFYQVFTDISSKTIQRDLQDLIMRNVLKKEGEKRWTIYSLSDSNLKDTKFVV